ncbi:MAG: peptidoglycan editing factor PgeF [Rickettsiales bacterium]|nr:peptidoglycan editing factor PgeF [Rickettsiales bacterium]
MTTNVKAENLENLDGITHGFFTRQGGVSTGIYASLNTGRGSNDSQQSIGENRALVRKEMGADALCSLHQTHSADVIEVTMPWVPSDLPKADAMVTNREGLALGILTADCVPVLFADVGAGVIGAAHSGWKGTQAGIIQNTVKAMEKLGAEASHIVAAIGPCISQESYQVDTLFRANLISADERTVEFFERDSDQPTHYLFNLKAYALLQCQRAGLSNIETLKNNTYAQEDLFYSYRRSCHRNESDYGRQVSAIMLQE